MQDLNALQQKALEAIEGAQDLRAVEALRVEMLGKQGEISQRMRGLGAMDPEARKTAGEILNKVRDAISSALESRKTVLAEAALEARLEAERVDVTLPVRPSPEGRIHILNDVMDQVIQIFADMGFVVAEGPDIEDDFHNFTALNIPASHPARQEQDTFYLPPVNAGDEPRVLRTHTSPVQIRSMMQHQPPLRIIAPGRVYRSDYDQTHTPTFHQIEGLYVDKAVNFGQLKGCIIEFCRRFFERPDLPVRFRPGYFPFTEPSAEVDIGCARKEGKLQLGAGGDWLEILGCGMVHPNVLRNCGIDPDVYQGFAFGMGIERITMLKYEIADLRAFYESDLRWLRHYGVNAERAFLRGAGR